jgi:hypothetical protein
VSALQFGIVSTKVRIARFRPLYLDLESAVVGGRPDAMRLVKEIYASWRAEVVFVTSNPQGNQEIMEGCMEAGIPAFVGSRCPILTGR